MDVHSTLNLKPYKLFQERERERWEQGNEIEERSEGGQIREKGKKSTEK